MQIVEEEARLVQRIYALFLDGQTPSSIAAVLTRKGVPTPAGKERWRDSTIRSILSNEKYKGDSLQQKTFTVDFLNKKIKVNEGEVPQYYVENSHPAIVSKEVFDLTQAELARRRRSGKHTSAVSVFSNRLVCGDCGGFFGSKVWHSNDPYRCVIWRCNRKYEKRAQDENSGAYHHRCSAPHLREGEIRVAFVSAINQLLSNKEEILSAYETIIAELTDMSSLEAEQSKLDEELSGLYARMNQMVQENAQVAQDQGEYNRRYDELTRQSDAVKEKLSRVKERMAEKTGRKRVLDAFMAQVRSAEKILEFDEKLFVGTVDRVVVYGAKDSFTSEDSAKEQSARNQKRLKFIFKDGTEVMVEG